MHLKFISRHFLFPWIIINDYPLWAPFNQLQLYSLSPMCLQFFNYLTLYTIIALLLTVNYSTILRKFGFSNLSIKQVLCNISMWFKLQSLLTFHPPIILPTYSYSSLIKFWNKRAPVSFLAESIKDCIIPLVDLFSSDILI